MPTRGTWCPGPSYPPDRSSPAPQPAGQQASGNPYLKGVLGEAQPPPARPIPSSASVTGGSSSRRGKLKALVAMARSILVIVWHLLADRAARSASSAPATCASRIDKNQ